jgi:hypothetical protein
VFLLDATAGIVPASHCLYERIPPKSTWDTAPPRKCPTRDTPSIAEWVERGVGRLRCNWGQLPYFPGNSGPARAMVGNRCRYRWYLI